MVNTPDMIQDANKVKNKASNVGHNISEFAEDQTEKGKEFFNEAKEKAKNGLSDAQEAISNYIKKNPYTTIGLSILSGIIIGELLKK